jgi:hypothetical protein
MLPVSLVTQSLVLVGNLNGSFDESSIHLGADQTLSEGHECSFAKRRLLGIQTVQHKLPSTIHERRFDHFVIGHTCVRLPA